MLKLEFSLFFLSQVKLSVKYKALKQVYNRCLNTTGLVLVIYSEVMDILVNLVEIFTYLYSHMNDFQLV